MYNKAVTALFHSSVFANNHSTPGAVSSSVRKVYLLHFPLCTLKLELLDKMESNPGLPGFQREWI
jgi:hypothetical protein